ncbi:Uncharacterized protein ABC855_g2024 [[Candida] zeylanoides]
MLASLLAAVGDGLRLASQCRQYRLLKRRASASTLSFDHQAMSVVAYACGVLSSLNYIFNPLVSRQYRERYPTFGLQRLPVISSVLILNAMGLVVSMAILLKMLSIRSGMRPQPEGVSLLLIGILSGCLAIAGYIVYCIHYGRAALRVLDLIDYIWLVGAVLDPLRLVPQLVMIWFEDCVPAALSQQYWSYESLSVVSVFLGKLRSGCQHWLLIPFNQGTYYYVFMMGLSLAVLQFQIIYYRHSTRSSPEKVV